MATASSGQLMDLPVMLGNLRKNVKESPQRAFSGAEQILRHGRGLMTHCLAKLNYFEKIACNFTFLVK